MLESNHSMSQRLASLQVPSNLANSCNASTRPGESDANDTSTIRVRRLSKAEQQDLEINQTMQLSFAFDRDLQKSNIYRRSLRVRPDSSLSSGQGDDDDTSTIGFGQLIQKEQQDLEISQMMQLRFAFDHDLQKSRVYQRNLRMRPYSSLSSTVGHSIAWSFLSGLSLADISCVSVVSLPISGQEVRVSSYYENKDAGKDVRSSYLPWISEEKAEDSLSQRSLSGAPATKNTPPENRFANLNIRLSKEPTDALRLCRGCDMVLLNPVLRSSTA